ncbi:hypothetical protein Ari01nite_75730 [Paractinoplanes rishiriensis]|uniref:Oxidoreductase FAD/NAD(P)-binding domain-containing protein n=1 Tax=Paractinoplanes rishiriensis TaxID=1050105 RepID=A0A919K4N6_9ACTN|nr:hypothetical protein Ari01nite_75730 [Actinoplanes rishiriensis]
MHAGAASVHHLQPAGETALRLTIKELGDYTRRLGTDPEPGRTVIVEGGYGMLDYRTGVGGRRHRRDTVPQLAPRRAFAHPARRPFLLCRTPSRRGNLLAGRARRAEPAPRPARVPARLVRDGRADGRPDRRPDRPVADAEIYLCGPQPMIASLERGLRQSGVSPRAIHFEEFAFR